MAAFSFFCVASESFGPVGNANGKVLLNGPYANSFNDFGASLFGVIMIAAIFGTSILRDFQRDTYQMIFTKPISKGAYLGGRWAGSFVTTVFAFSGMMLGTWLGTFAPWADHTRIAPNHLWWYLQPFLSINVIQIFFLGSLFFAAAALTRKIFIVYLQGVALFMIYIVGLTVYFAARSLEHFWSGILDPIGLILLDNITRYWTVVDKNTLLLPWDMSGNSPGVFLYNRLLLDGRGRTVARRRLGFLPDVGGGAHRQVAEQARGEGEAGGRGGGAPAALTRGREPAARAPAVRPTHDHHAVSLAVAPAHPEHRARNPVLGDRGAAHRVRHQQRAVRRARGRPERMARDLPHAAGGGRLGNALLLHRRDALRGELVWRERDTHFDGIHDALPMSVTTDWLSKLTAIAFVELVLLTVTMLVGMFMQTTAGYYHYEPLQYLKELFVITFPQLIAFSLFALFVQTMVSNKFVGHGIVIGVFVLVPILYNFGWENTLYLPGQVPVYAYSDMNGYGHFVSGLFWAITYWLSIMAVLGVVSIAYTRRGAEDSFGARTRLARARAPRLAPAAAILLALAIGAAAGSTTTRTCSTAIARLRTAGTRRRSTRRSSSATSCSAGQGHGGGRDGQHLSRRRSFDGTARYTLQNKSAAPIAQVHVTDEQEATTNVAFDRPFHIVRQGAARPVHDLRARYAARAGRRGDDDLRGGAHDEGFRDGNEAPELAYNGTFFDSGYFPSIGYDAGFEVDDPRRRREERLGPLVEMAPRGDSVHSRINLSAPAPTGSPITPW